MITYFSIYIVYVWRHTYNPIVLFDLKPKFLGDNMIKMQNVRDSRFHIYLYWLLNHFNLGINYSFHDWWRQQTTRLLLPRSFVNQCQFLVSRGNKNLKKCFMQVRCHSNIITPGISLYPLTQITINMGIPCEIDSLPGYPDY